jgi:putative DNA methylase
MSDSATQTPRKKLIEVSIPLEAINAEAKRRKQKAPKGYPTSIHKYWAQRPIAACRAVLFAQLVDDPSSWPDRFPGEESQDAERRRLHRVIEDLVPWEASNNETILTAARWEIARSVAWGLGEEPPAKGDGKAILDYLQVKAPPVYDPFSGGASIPLEAQRLGLRSYGSDLNPIAVLIGKALVEMPANFAGRPPVNPEALGDAKHGQLRSWRGAQGLAEDVRYFGQWMRKEAEKAIGALYPKAKLPDGSDATVIAWIWARTVRSPDPRASGAIVPLLSTFLLSQKSEGAQVWLEPVLVPDDNLKYQFKIRSGTPNKDDAKRIRAGLKTGRGSNFTCLVTGSAISESHIKAEGNAGRIGTVLIAMVADSHGKRIYLPAEAAHVDIAASVIPRWSPDIEMPRNPRWFSPPEFGLKTYGSLFSARQLVSLETMSDLVAQARDEVFKQSNSEQYAIAVATYLAFAVDRMATYGSTLCKWLVKDSALAPSIPNQAISMSYDFAEANPFGKSSGEITQCVGVVAACLEHAPYDSPGIIFQALAQSAKIEDRFILATDPPYYDNIGYADISEFFYVWIARSLKTCWPEYLRRIGTPKDQELVATPYRHGGTEAAEKYFESGIKDALGNLFSGAEPLWPVTIFYAFKQTEDDANGTSSKGWSTFLQGIVDSGVQIDGTWPLRTELTSALKNEVNSLASSVALVCRRRTADAETIVRADFIRVLKREMPNAIDAIRKAGVGPVDMQQSVIGPGMGIFSRYAKVLEDDDSTMPVKTALSLINRVWGEIENELDANFDPQTQVALAWYSDYGFDARASGDLIMLANAKNITSDALFASDVFTNLRGKAALTLRDALPANWTPSSDKTVTVWECVQQTARVLRADDGGGVAAGRLVAEMGPKAAEARILAYRLFEIATQKGRAAEALIYNELAQEWPKLEDLASTADVRVAIATVQAELF